MAEAPAAPANTQRIDQWLWFSRIVKSRTLAQALIERGKVRLNRTRIEKSSQSVKPGDVITISLGPKVRVLEVAALGIRRGPATEASRLYIELTERQTQPTNRVEGETAQPAPAARPQGSGRPTKRDRRAIDRLKDFG